jgi:hypothetical protein
MQVENRLFSWLALVRWWFALIKIGDALEFLDLVLIMLKLSKLQWCSQIE